MAITFEQRFWSNVDVRDTDSCWEWKRAKIGKRFRYGVTFMGGKTTLAHRASYHLKIGEIPAGMCVCHKCDNPPCCNPNHLFLGTIADNNADRDRKGRRRDNNPSGERHWKCKLTKENIRDIIIDYMNTDATLTTIARKYRISESHASRIINGRSWFKPFDFKITSRKRPKNTHRVSESVALLIKSQHASGKFSQRAIAERHKIGQSYVNAIIHGRSWIH